MSSTVYFVSGGNRGIGLALVKKLSTLEKSTVITTARNTEKATDLNEWIAKHSNVHVLKYDATIHSDAVNVASEIEKRFGGIDVFVANSGAGEDPKPVLDTPIESWTRIYNINVVGPIVLFKSLYPLLIKRETRKVLFVSSALGSQQDMSPYVSSNSYGQSKSAINFTAKELSIELAAENFIIVPIHPGLVESDMGNGYIGKLGENSPELEAQLRSGMLTTEQSANAISDLISGLIKEDNGKFLSYDKTVLAW